MQTVHTDNLDLALQGNTATMALSGNMKAETFDKTLEWIETAAEERDDLSLKLDIPGSAFDDLGQASKAFRRVADALRRTTAWDKCAVITDSGYLQNSFKVESAVIPGLDLMVFQQNETDAAEAWLKGETLAADVEKEEQHAPTQATTKWGKLDLAKVDY